MMKAHIYKAPLPPDNRTDEEKEQDRKIAIKTLAQMAIFKQFLIDTNPSQNNYLD